MSNIPRQFVALFWNKLGHIVFWWNLIGSSERDRFQETCFVGTVFLATQSLAVTLNNVVRGKCFCYFLQGTTRIIFILQILKSRFSTIPKRYGTMSFDKTKGAVCDSDVFNSAEASAPHFGRDMRKTIVSWHKDDISAEIVQSCLCICI